MSLLRQNQPSNDVYTTPQELVYSVAEYISLLNVQLKPLKATIQGEIGKIKYYPRTGDCSKDTGLLSSCPRLMQGMKGLLTPFALGFSPHVECDACLDLLLGSYTINAFLHLAITPITPLHRIGG